MNALGANMSRLGQFLRRLLPGPQLPVPSREEHEEYLRGAAQRIMAHHGEGNVLLSAGQVHLGDDVDYSENDDTAA